MQFLYRFSAMTTPCEVLLFSEEKGKADVVAQLILKETKRLEKKYNYFSADSYLSLLNNRQNDYLDYETKNLLQRAIRYYNLTGHIFDITLATIKDLYKISTSLEELNRAKENLLPYIGCEHLHIKKNRLFFDNEYTKIDFGGFVKEYAVDQAVKIIEKSKIKNALINFGGDIFAVGRKPNDQKFKVGIKDPDNPKQFVQFEEIENEALTTSASYERNTIIEGKLFSHILSLEDNVDNPSSVTVISKNCVESGVFSTALMVDPKIKTNNRAIII